MKTIITLSNPGEKGKSSTLLELANLMLAISGCKTIFSSKPVATLSKDFTLIIEINHKIIAFESQGDPGTDLENRLDNIVRSYNPDIIFCACRTRGETVAAIGNIAHKHIYHIIWTSTYKTTHSHNIINRLKAEHLQDLVIKLGLI